jgi:hypothetical protein
MLGTGLSKYEYLKQKLEWTSHRPRRQFVGVLKVGTLEGQVEY